MSWFKHRPKRHEKTHPLYPRHSSIHSGSQQLDPKRQTSDLWALPGDSRNPDERGLSGVSIVDRKE